MRKRYGQIPMQPFFMTCCLTAALVGVALGAVVAFVALLAPLLGG